MSSVNVIVQVVVPVLYCTISAVGLFGNGIVLCIMWMLVKSKSVTDVYVTNLAIADMLLLTTLPFWAADLIMGEWVFGQGMCKVISCMTYMNMYASIFFLTAMSLDRWLAIVKAVKCRSLRTVRNAWITCISIWCVGLLFVILPALYRTSEPSGRGIRKCIWRFPRESTYSLNVLYNVLRTFLGFLLPLVIIVFCYFDLIRFLQKRSVTKRRKTSVAKSQQNRKDKVTKMVLVVISCFVISWLPNQITNFIHLLKLTGFINYGCSNTVRFSTPSYSPESNYNVTEQLTVVNVTGIGWQTADLLFSNSSISSPVLSEVTSAREKVVSCATNYWTVFYAHLISACLGFSNSMMNPIVYSFMGAVFRKKMCQLLTCAPKGSMHVRHRASFWTSTRLATTRTRFSTVIFSRKSARFQNQPAGEPVVKISGGCLNVDQGAAHEQECLFPDHVEERLDQLRPRNSGAPVTRRMNRNNHMQNIKGQRCVGDLQGQGQGITGVAVDMETDDEDQRLMPNKCDLGEVNIEADVESDKEEAIQEVVSNIPNGDLV